MGKTKVWCLGIHAKVVKLLRTKRKYYKSQDSGYLQGKWQVGEFWAPGSIFFFLPWIVVEYLIWIVSLYFGHFMYTSDF